MKSQQIQSQMSSESNSGNIPCFNSCGNDEKVSFTNIHPFQYKIDQYIKKIKAGGLTVSARSTHLLTPSMKVNLMGYMVSMQNSTVLYCPVRKTVLYMLPGERVIQYANSVEEMLKLVAYQVQHLSYSASEVYWHEYHKFGIEESRRQNNPPASIANKLYSIAISFSQESVDFASYCYRHKITADKHTEYKDSAVYVNEDNLSIIIVEPVPGSNAVICSAALFSSKEKFDYSLGFALAYLEVPLKHSLQDYEI